MTSPAHRRAAQTVCVRRRYTPMILQPRSRYDAPGAAGLDVVIRGLTLTSGSDHDTLGVTGKLFDGLYEHTRRQLLTGRPPA